MTTDVTQDNTQPRRRRVVIKRIVRVLGACVLALVLAGMIAWATLAVALADLETHPPRYLRASLIPILTIAGVIVVKPRRFKWFVPMLVFAGALIWFLSLQASNVRDWQTEVARVAHADIDGDRLTLHNVRNFDYQPGGEAIPRWEDRTYDLARLKTVDLILCYWGSPDVAHIIGSFGFDDGRFLAVSIETRREKNEKQSSIQSFFRQYELIYVFGDERDLLRLRTNYRKEDLYLYRTRLSPAQARKILLSYLARANELAANPDWYNTITTNCATGVLPHARAAGAPGRWSLDVLFSGRAARQAYHNGLINTRLPFEELKARSRINSAAVAAEEAADFSKRIRADLPEANP